MRGRQVLQTGIGLQTGQKRDLLVGQEVEDRPFGEARVEPQLGHIAQLLGLAGGFQKETFGAAGGMHVARPQHGMHKALAQPQAILKAVVVAAHRVAGHQRMKDLLVIVAVVLDPRLCAVSLNRKAVDVDGDAPCGMVVARGPQMTARPIGQRLAEDLGIRFVVSQSRQQSRLGGLAGQPLFLCSLARTIPSGHSHGRIMGQLVHVVLGVVALGHGVQAFAEQFHQGIADAIRMAAVVQLGGQRLRQAQAMIGLPQQQRSRVAGQPILSAPHLHRTIERGLKQQLLAFTHQMTPFDFSRCREQPLFLRHSTHTIAEGRRTW